jgi:uncharacterized protein
MYWQVYIHKTTVGIEKMLVQIIRRVREVADDIQITPDLAFFIKRHITSGQIMEDKAVLQAFCRLDDYDIIGGIKSWTKCQDFVLSELCSMFLERRLFNVVLSEQPVGRKQLSDLKVEVQKTWNIDETLVGNFVIVGEKSNAAYIGGGQQIKLLTKAGEVVDIANAADLPNIKAMRKIVKKYYLCWPKNITLQTQ